MSQIHKLKTDAMNTTLKYIILAVVVVGIIAIVAFSNILKGIEVGSVFATLAGGFAAFKSKIFKSSSSLDTQINEVKLEHATKRDEWKTLKEEFDNKFNALKSRMDYIDLKSTKIYQEINKLNEDERNALKNDLDSNSDDLLDFLNS